MRGRLQPDRGHARSGIASALRHLLDLFEDQLVESAGCDLGEAELAGTEEQGQAHNDFREIIFQNDATQIEREPSCGNQGAAIFNRRRFGSAVTNRRSLG